MSGLLGGKSKTATSREPTMAAGFRPQTSTLGKAIALAYGTNRSAANLMWYGDFVAVAHTESSDPGGGGNGGKGGDSSGGGAGTTTYTYSVALMMGICEGPIAGIGKAWADKNAYSSIAGLGFSAILGTYTQDPWTYLTTNHPSEALAYRGIASAVASGFTLGDSPNLPQISWEVQGRFRYDPGSGIVDANPKDIIDDLLSNPHCGVVGFPALVDMEPYSDWCVANGFFLSPIIETQEEASSIITRLCMLTLSEPVWHEGALTIIPRADQSVTGNGVTFTPDMTPQYDLDEDSFLPREDGPPVQISITDAVDSPNQLIIECVDRNNDYNIAPVEWRDQGAVDLYGLRSSQGTIVAHEITDPEVGVVIAQLLGQRGLYVQRRFQFLLPMNYCLLEAMDLVTLTESSLNLDRVLVRLIEITDGEEEDGRIEVTAEEVLTGTSVAAAYASQGSEGAMPNFNAPAGDVNEPVIFNAPGILTESGFEVWAALSSADEMWGGVEVYLSSDGTTYQRVGSLLGKSRQGVLTAAFPSGNDPDTVNECMVTLAMSKGELLSGVQSDADNLNTLCLVDDELIAYQDATLTGINAYTLETYIRRGIFNTPVAAHTIGARFVRCDQSLFRYPYPTGWIGKTIFLKFLSFNRWGGALQTLDESTAYTFLIDGPAGAPDDVTNFAVGQNGPLAIFTWTLLTQRNVAGYEIRYCPPTAGVPTEADWESATPLTRVTRGTQITTAKLPPGTWALAIKAVDSSGKYSITATWFYPLVMASTFDLIREVQAAPDWIGRDYELLFGGAVGNRVIVPVPSSFEFGMGSFSFAFWMMPTTVAPASLAHFLSKYFSGLGGYGIRINTNGKLNALLSDGSNVVSGDIGSYTFTALRRTHVCVTVDRTTNLMTGFINGQSIGTIDISAVTGSTSNDSTDYTIGCHVGGTGPYQGAMDEILAYTRALIPEEVSDVYEGKEILDDLYSRWDCDTGSGTDVAERGEAGGVGQFVGNVTWRQGYGKHFVRMPSGVLIPDSKDAVDMNSNDWIDSFVPSPFGFCTYEHPELDLTIDGLARIWAELISVLGPGEAGVADPQLEVDHHTTLTSYDGYEAWSIGSVVCRYVKTRLVLTTGDGNCYISSFKPTVDAEEREEVLTVTIAPGGTAIVFAQPFRITPSVELFNVEATPKIPAISAGPTTTGFTGKDFDTAGADVGGQVRYIARGI